MNIYESIIQKNLLNTIRDILRAIENKKIEHFKICISFFPDDDLNFLELDAIDEPAIVEVIISTNCFFLENDELIIINKSSSEINKITIPLENIIHFSDKINNLDLDLTETTNETVSLQSNKNNNIIWVDL